MVGRTNAGGGDGGSSSFVAYIQITTDANAVISAVNPAGDTFSGTADSTGSLTLTVTAAGTYTVSIIGTASSATVQVIDSGETYTLSVYTWDGSLYYNGNEYSDITGGWIGVANGSTALTKQAPTITRGSDSISAMERGYNVNGMFLTTSKIDLSSFTMLDIVGGVAQNNGAGKCWIVLYDGNTISRITEITNSGSQFSMTWGIGTYTGEYQVGFELQSPSTTALAYFTVTITEMKLRS